MSFWKGSIIGGVLSQVLALVSIVLMYFVSIIIPALEGLLMILLWVILIVFMPFAFFLVPEGRHVSAVVNVVAIGLDIFLYTLVTYAILRWRATTKAVKEQRDFGLSEQNTKEGKDSPP